MGTNILNLLDNKNVEIVSENEQAGVTIIKMIRDSVAWQRRRQ